MAKLPIAVPSRAPPDAGPFNWFAYASTLDATAFRDWCAQHGYVVPNLGAAIPARLDGYRLSFDVTSRFWGGAVASLVEAPGHAVEGLLIPLPGEGRTLADHKEGAVSGLYEAFDVQVVPLSGGPQVPALAYRSAPTRRLPSEGTPSAAFLDVLIRGARAVGLTAPYLIQLESLRPKP
jgi:gamma-glutamylcyclotransferase